MIPCHSVRLPETGPTFFLSEREAPGFPPPGYKWPLLGHRPSLLLSHNDQPPWRENLLEGPVLPSSVVLVA